MKKSSIIIFLLTLIPLFSNAQTKKINLETAAANGEYWQSSSDEGMVKCGHGFFINKMVIKLNYDAPDDLIEVNSSNEINADNSKSILATSKEVKSKPKNNAANNSKIISTVK